MGHDVEVSFDLPVCGPCEGTAGDVTRPTVAKQVMRLVPQYKELLSYYPELTLTISRQPK
jgi:hypothetical protein